MDTKPEHTSMESQSETVSIKEKIYDDLGTNYRFFLGWRHAAFAGILVVLYFIISLTISTYKDYPLFACLVPLITSPIGILLWIIDRRTRDLYHVAMNAGKNLEGNDGGFYTELIKKSEEEQKVDQNHYKNSFTLFLEGKFTQSFALNILFIGSSFILYFSAIFIFIVIGTKELLHLITIYINLILSILH